MVVTKEQDSFAVRLKKLREAAKLSQKELAERAGVSVSIVFQSEQGQRIDPKMSTLVKLARALGVGVEQLIASEE